MAPIDPGSWQRLEPFFDQLLDTDPAGREAWFAAFEETVPGDADLLRDLLAAHEAESGRLDIPLAEAAARLVAESMDDPLIGQTLGAFRVEKEIGRGGMGVVYHGIRVDGEFDQDVVIKVLRLGVDSEETRRRFLQERQILARLDHPTIVRVLDGGFTGDGRPYIVMNEVVGQQLDRYCDEQRLDVRARVRLFLNVIEAVDHAHRHLVIHRDLKPGNVWVDSNGKVSLLDFGIAKIIEDEGTGGLTVTQNRVMTPEYASPEQFLGGEITTASDVYQLGLLLYQLLTGQLPYGEKAGSAREMEKQVCEADPVPASRAVTSMTRAQTEAFFLTRDLPAGKLKKILSGDLDLILLKALRKEPERRYNTAHGFRADLIRWLSGERIMARPDSFGYQARRFVRRHPMALVLTATIILGTAGFTLFHLKQITSERDIARLESEQRKEVSDFLVNLLRIPDPTAAEGREVTARELLADSYPRIRDDLTNPATKIRLLAVVGEVSKNLGLFDQADSALTLMTSLSAELYGPRSLETANALYELSAQYRTAREYDKALGPAEESLSIKEELLPPGHLDIGFALNSVALVHRELGDYQQAEVELREAMAIVAAQLPEDDPRLTNLKGDLAYVLRTVKEWDESEVLYRQVIAEMRARPDEFPGTLPAALNNLAYLLKQKEKYPEAAALYREAIQGMENFHGEAHPRTVMFRGNLAAVLQQMGEYEEARQALETNVEQQIHLNGADHWRVGVTQRTLGFFLFMIGQFEDAEPAYLASGETFSRVLGPDHPWTATVGAMRAVNLHCAGDEARAEPLWNRCLPILDSPEARGDRNVQTMLNLLVENIPDGNEAWSQRVSGLIAGESGDDGSGR